MLSNLQGPNPSNLNFCSLNINSVTNKVTDFQEIMNGNVDIVSIAETKIGASFPSAQFVFEQYHLPYRLDISSKSGGILLYVKSSISSCRLSCENLSDSIQAVPFEISFTDTYDNYLILDDFNIERSGPSLKAHLNSNNPYNLIKNKTCFKDKGSHIDLFLTNRKYSLSLVARMRQVLVIIII